MGNQARIAADVILGKPVRYRSSADCIPRDFTDPQVAAVGLTEREAREAYPNVRVVSYGTGEVAGAYVQCDGIEGTSQLVVDDEDRRVPIGATLTGPDVQELLHSATVAIAGRVPAFGASAGAEGVLQLR